MNKIIALIAVLFSLGTTATHAADSAGTPFTLSNREHTFLAQKVCGPYDLKANKIKAYAFNARDAKDGKIALDARTSAYVECESHGNFNNKPMRYIDECDLVEGEWDCSPPQLEVTVDINGRDVRMRPWSMTPDKAYSLLKDISIRGQFQGESLDKAIGNSCDIAKNKDPDIIELGCEASMSISYWCPQAKTTGCPRVLFLSFDEPAFKRRP